MRKVREPTPSAYAAEPRAPRSTSVVVMRASTARPGKSYRHGDLRKALLDATLALIEEHGPEGVTLRAAARRAGVSASAKEVVRGVLDALDPRLNEPSTTMRRQLG